MIWTRFPTRLARSSFHWIFYTAIGTSCIWTENRWLHAAEKHIPFILVTFRVPMKSSTQHIASATLTSVPGTDSFASNASAKTQRKSNFVRLSHNSSADTCNVGKSLTARENAATDYPKFQIRSSSNTRQYREVKSSYPRAFWLVFETFFLFHLLMEVFPFVLCHPLEPVDPPIEDSYEGFLPDFVENVSGRAF
jgi:hypothetical protein